ncbi:hypothetical protein Rsub_01901 [Raphidocelis subcapitata]|uniref:Uncharacterized protein n=1 Tax=Raphidocelis subcapitata TaxID=307507 RepID=A0A2V0NNN4_9CHLO|nr:hypothetical protein Rsub_01901 [Raphidocelis subcapitata]|eukprot:GBF89184.1 hypothetical protein Rsub_01901 [Raphidocelis subcapitata]
MPQPQAPPQPPQAPAKGLSPCDVEALKRCLEQHKGDHKKCEAEVLAFKRACGREAGGNAGGAGQPQRAP